MKSDKSPTGIYCANDITAIGMLKYLAKCKNRYYTPSIISSDGIEEAQYTTPMLTTVEISKTDMGHFALQLLMDRLKGGHKGVTRIELQCKLIKRDSCTLAEDSKCANITFNIRTICRLFMYPCPYIQFLYSISVSSSCPSRDYSVVSSVVVSPVVITVPPRYHSPSFS